MSQKRQINKAVFDRIGHRRSEITTLTHDYAAGHVIALHFHEADQLVYASRGVMTVRTKDGIWVVPTDRAVWIPARIPHTITMSGIVAMRTLYLRKRGECFGVAEGTYPASVCIFEVDEEDFAAAPLDRNNSGSARRDTDGTAAASKCFRRKSGPDHASASQRSE
jgi:mannose-6-phosphate isomerase-like protein (cupin superfamily)